MSTPIMAITTNNSIRVNAQRRHRSEPETMRTASEKEEKNGIRLRSALGYAELLTALHGQTGSTSLSRPPGRAQPLPNSHTWGEYRQQITVVKEFSLMRRS